MRTQAGVLLAAFALTLPALAQTQASPAADKSAAVEKLWKIETSGIGG